MEYPNSIQNTFKTAYIIFASMSMNPILPAFVPFISILTIVLLLVYHTRSVKMMVSESMDHPLFYKFFIFPGNCKKKKMKLLLPLLVLINQRHLFELVSINILFQDLSPYEDKM